MDCNELLILLTLGAVAPYLAEAASSWLASTGRHKTSAHAPSGIHCRRSAANE